MTQQYPPYGAPSWPQQHPATPLRKPRRWPWIAGIVVAFLVGLGVGGGSGTPMPASTTAAAPSPPPAGTPSGVDPSTFDASPPAVSGGLTVETITPSGPLTRFSDGTYEVGTGDGQIAPGKYTSPGSGGTCYWARLKNNDGALGDIVDNNLGEGQMILNVRKGDGYVEIRGCEFTKAA